MQDSAQTSIAGGAPSASAALGRAVDAVRWVLFSPFDFRKWAVLALTVFLGNCSHHVGPYYQGGSASALGSPSGLGPAVDQFLTGAGMSPSGFGAAFFVVQVVIWLAALWLNSRMDLVAFDNVARGRGRIAEPWGELGREGTSLFVARVALYAVMLTVTSLAVALAGGSVAAKPMAMGQPPDLAAVMRDLQAALRPLLLLSPLWVVFLLVQLWLNALVVPVMYARRLRIGAALRESWRIAAADPGAAALYLVLQAGLGMAAVSAMGFATMVFGCVLCFTLCVPFLPNLLATFAVLPMLAGLRMYAGAYIEQFGPQYRFFRLDEEYLDIAARSAQGATAEEAYVPLPRMEGGGKDEG